MKTHINRCNKLYYILILLYITIQVQWYYMRHSMCCPSLVTHNSIMCKVEMKALMQHFHLSLHLNRRYADLYVNVSKWKSLSHVQLFATPWTIQSVEFSKQTASGLPFPSPGDLPIPRIKPRSPTLQADSLPSEL